MTDLVARLRESAAGWLHEIETRREAADELAALRAEVERLRAALESLIPYQDFRDAALIIDRALGTSPSPGASHGE